MDRALRNHRYLTRGEPARYVSRPVEVDGRLGVFFSADPSLQLQRFASVP